MLMIEPLPRGGHARREGRDQVIGGAYVGREHLIEVADGHIGGRAPHREAGVVDENVNVASLVGELGDPRRIVQTRRPRTQRCRLPARSTAATV